jgi:hypothetical protein
MKILVTATDPAASLKSLTLLTFIIREAVCIFIQIIFFFLHQGIHISLVEFDGCEPSLLGFWCWVNSSEIATTIVQSSTKQITA